MTDNINCDLKGKGEIMKSRVRFLIFVMIFCSMFIGFVNSWGDVSGVPPELEKVLREFISSLQFLQSDDLSRTAVLGKFNSWKISNRFAIREACVDGPAIFPTTEVEDMADYWMEIRNNRIQYSYEVVYLSPIDKRVTDDYKINQHADCKITFSWEKSPDHEGEILLTLYHIKRCTWN